MGSAVRIMRDGFKGDNTRYVTGGHGDSQEVLGYYGKTWSRRLFLARRGGGRSWACK